MKSDEASIPPQRHHDGGGGSAQFIVKGGDNSFQEFGTEAPASERQQAADALHSYFRAALDQDLPAACSFMAKQIKQSTAELVSPHGDPKPCPANLALLWKGIPKVNFELLAQADVGALRLRGDRGYLLYHGAAHRNYAMPVALEGGRWKVNALEGSVLV